VLLPLKEIAQLSRQILLLIWTSTEKLNVLGFTSPENVGMNPLILNKIEAIAQKAINGKMAPECKF
jgi:hypothetical protein